MPKRKRISNKIERYRNKIRKLEERERKKQQENYSSNDSENNSENGERTISEPVNLLDEGMEIHQEVNTENDNDGNKDDSVENAEISELDADVLSALGEKSEEAPKFGPKVHESLPSLWQPILLKGLNKEVKDRLLKENLTPENCALLRAPTLNPEISAAVSDSTRARDKRVENVQQQLGTGISAVIKGIDLLLDGEKRLEAIKVLSDGCRLLCDLHFVEGEARKKFITPGLDKAFSNLIQDVPRDEMLFSTKLPEKIKASKLIEKQGLQIKKPAPVQKPATPSSSQPSNSRQRPSGNWSPGNWSAPPRFSSRGGRGGGKRSGPVNRGRSHSTTARPSNQPKQRAPHQQ